MDRSLEELPTTKLLRDARGDSSKAVDRSGRNLLTGVGLLLITAGLAALGASMFMKTAPDTLWAVAAVLLGCAFTITAAFFPTVRGEVRTLALDLDFGEGDAGYAPEIHVSRARTTAIRRSEVEARGIEPLP